MNRLFSLLLISMVLLTSACKSTKTVEATNPPPPPPPPLEESVKVTPPSTAQRPPAPFRSNSNPLIEGLGLDEEQKTKFKEIQDRYMKEMQEMRSLSGGNKKGMMEEMQKMRLNQDLEIEEVMTEEQYLAYKERIAQRMNRNRKSAQ